MLIIVAVLASAGASVAVSLWRTIDLPPPGAVRNPEASVIRWRDGTVLARIGKEDRKSVPLTAVSLAMRHAVLAAEDRDFYKHHAISGRSVLRAMRENLTRGEIAQGGSTITQQYVRNAYLSQERTWKRKIREAVLALKLERRLPKDVILERYLNTVYFGRGAYGVEAAARVYFGGHASTLSIAQAAVLAGLLRSPILYDPARNPALARERWRYVLRGMAERHWVNAPQRLRYPKVRSAKAHDVYGGTTGYLVQQVLAALRANGLEEEQVRTAGLSVVTTFDRATQSAAERAMRSISGTRATKGVLRALVAVEPGTGRIRASYSGRDYLARPLDAVTQGRAQAGSSFKAYVLAAALRKNISLRSRFDGSSPQTFGSYEVKNFGSGPGEQFGRIDLLQATAHSVNTVFVPLGMKAGTRNVAATAASLGIRANMRRERDLPSISLGVTSVTPLEQAVAYATLAAGGIRAEPYVVESVSDRTGRVILNPEPRRHRVLKAEVATDVTYALHQAVEEGTGHRARVPGRDVAGKTGTTSGNTAAWFVGYTPRLATAVAIYRNGSGRPLPSTRGFREVTGGSLPARVWSAFTARALQSVPPKRFPPPAFLGHALGTHAGYATFGEWHLAVDPDASEDTKGRYAFPYGDFAKVNRAALIHAKQRAAQNDHDEVEKAADELLNYLDEKSG